MPKGTQQFGFWTRFEIWLRLFDTRWTVGNKYQLCYVGRSWSAISCWWSSSFSMTDAFVTLQYYVLFLIVIRAKAVSHRWAWWRSNEISTALPLAPSITCMWVYSTRAKSYPYRKLFLLMRILNRLVLWGILENILIELECMMLVLGCKLCSLGSTLKYMSLDGTQ